MASIEFYYMPESPFCRSVEMVAGLAGLDLNKHYVNLFKKEHLTEEYTKLNPLQKVPFITDGDLKIGESRAIMVYLVERYMPQNNTLYPRDPVIRAKVDEILYLDCSLLFPTISKLFKPRMFGLSKELNSEDEKALHDLLIYLEDRLQSNGGKRFLLTDEINLGDIALSVTLSMLIANDYVFNEYKSLAFYYRQLIESIPNYASINDKPIDNIRTFIKANQNQENTHV